ncbi:hypothetical protein MMC13_001207 [Lambiella insularis]|nr:hypothetical protein [Lambiella insularis]
MHHKPLPIDSIIPWSILNNVDMNGVTITASPTRKGSGIVVTKDISAEDCVLIRVPRELVLSLETIWEFAKCDHHLSSILTAVEDFGRTARGAILIFLLVQNTTNSAKPKIGNNCPWTEYVRFLPSEFSLPTYWTAEECDHLNGTSLEPAMRDKMRSIYEEFAHLKTCTEPLECCRVWWDEEIGCLTFQDYLQVDAVYRSRAMDLIGTGLALVPCIDMANHESGKETNAHYETDNEGNAVLILADGMSPKPGDEVFITYGDDKGAGEMLFSYGFIDEKLENARCLYLDLEIPDDDPLKHAKRKALDAAPGFRLFMSDEKVAWFGPFVWLQCVNEEDGLEMRLLQQNNNTTELITTWKDKEVGDAMALEHMLQEDNMYDIFRLRAYVVLNQRIKAQLSQNPSVHNKVDSRNGTDHGIRPCLKDLALKLVRLELDLLYQAAAQFDDTIMYLVDTDNVKRYLNPQAELAPPVVHMTDSEDDRDGCGDFS